MKRELDKHDAHPFSKFTYQLGNDFTSQDLDESELQVASTSNIIETPFTSFFTSSHSPKIKIKEDPESKKRKAVYNLNENETEYVPIWLKKLRKEE